MFKERVITLTLKDNTKLILTSLLFGGCPALLVKWVLLNTQYDDLFNYSEEEEEYLDLKSELCDLITDLLPEFIVDFSGTVVNISSKH